MKTQVVLLALLSCCLLTCRPISRVQDTPAFTPHDCWFELPSDREVTCGTVRVPEDRSLPLDADNEITLAVAIFHGDTPAPDPILFLAGGPGEPAIDAILESYPAFTLALQHRDLIVFDQRGTGYTEPYLGCRQDEEPLQGCRARLSDEGINLAMYTSATNAADVNDVRLALGYDQVNVWGGSYGTRLTFTVMRDFPEGVRSAVVDGVVPLQSHLDAGFAPNFDRAIHILFADCAAHPACSARYPDLEQTFYALVQQLDDQPVSLTLDTQTANGFSEITLDGMTFTLMLHQALYYTEALPYLPNLIGAASAGNFEPFKQMIMQFPANNLSEGMMFSVHCAEEVAYESPQEIEAEAAQLHPAVRQHLIDSNSTFFRVCEVWDVPPAPPFEEYPLVSDIPTLLLSGQYDPVSPSPWADLAAQTLSHSYTFEFPAQGHVAFRTSACARQIINAFLDDPTTPPDSACIATMAMPDFYVDEEE